MFNCLVICSQKDDLVRCLCMVSGLEGEPVAMVSVGSKNHLNLGTRGRR